MLLAPGAVLIKTEIPSFGLNQEPSTPHNLLIGVTTTLELCINVPSRRRVLCAWRQSSYWTLESLIFNLQQKKINLYLPSAVFIAQVRVGPSKQLKQIIRTEHNIVRIPTGRRQTSWLFYKRDRGFELGATQKQIQVVVRAGLKPDCESHTLTTRPRCLHEREVPWSVSSLG